MTVLIHEKLTPEAAWEAEWRERQRYGLEHLPTVFGTEEELDDFLAGFLKRFQFTPAASRWQYRVERHTGEKAIVFLGFAPWWDAEDGVPAVPFAELARSETGRLHRILRTVLIRAAERENWEYLTTMSRGDFMDLLRRVHIGA